MGRTPGGNAQRGVTYLALLLAIAGVSAVLAATATVWSQAQRREREAQLLWVGDQFRRALLAYAQAGNGVYPQRLEDLLEDPRSPAKRRFLRRVYDDPMTRNTDWVLVRDVRGGIVGVHSRSTAVPIKTGRFPTDYASFAEARSYAEWRFSAQALAPLARPASAPAGAASKPAGSHPDSRRMPAPPAPVAEAASAAPTAEAIAPTESMPEPPDPPEPPAQDE